MFDLDHNQHLKRISLRYVKFPNKMFLYKKLNSSKHLKQIHVLLNQEFHFVLFSLLYSYNYFISGLGLLCQARTCATLASSSSESSLAEKFRTAKEKSTGKLRPLFRTSENDPVSVFA